MSSSSEPAFDVLHFTTGGEEESTIIERRDAFFKKVLLDLGFEEAWLDRIPAQIVERALGTEQPNNFEPTDDRLHCLVVQNEALAMVLDRRNDGNYHEVTFWSRQLSQLAADSINDMVIWQNSQATKE